jgi:molybdopterin-guanine dinucleotide biosynthesis protein B
MIAVAGWKNSGKTTLVCRLIEHFRAQGLRVSTIKHSHHDVAFGANTDSERHRAAGAAQVTLVTPHRLALFEDFVESEAPHLDDIAARLDADLIIVEGFKSAAIPKIEVRRREAAGHAPLSNDDANVIAIAADFDVGAAKLPVFSLDDIAGIAAVIATRLGPLGKP